MAGLLLLLTGCAPTIIVGGDPGSPAAPAPDTLRGSVAVVGAEPLSSVVLVHGERRVRLEGAAAASLRDLRGLEVRVDGRHDGDRFRVESFRVRAVEGVPAADGVLELDGDAAVLVTAGGRRVRFAPVPAALRSRVGQRVWIAGPAGAPPEAWGVITPR